MRRDHRWVRVRPLTRDQKAEVTAACERLIAETLVPRYLPEIRPSLDRNYPVRIHGKWRGSRYSFLVRFRAGFPERLRDEFDAPFARLDHVEERLDAPRFDVQWMRHTGHWWLFHRDLTLDEALDRVANDEVLRPPI